MPGPLHFWPVPRLLVGEKAGGKLEKEPGVAVLTEDDFDKLIGKA